MSRCIAAAGSGSRPSRYALFLVLFEVLVVARDVCFGSIAVGRQSGTRESKEFCILPNAADFIFAPDQGSQIGMQVTSRHPSKGSTSSLTFTVAPRLANAETAKAVGEIAKRAPGALFSYPVPLRTDLSITTIQTSERELLPLDQATLLTGPSSFTISLTPIQARQLLLPQAMFSPSASFRYTYTIKGITREHAGTPVVDERTFTISGVLNGFCAPRPESTVDLNGGVIGCARVNFAPTLVRSIQEGLRTTGDYDGSVDDIFGDRTDYAIRSFQKRNGEYVTGYPTRELLREINGK